VAGLVLVLAVFVPVLTIAYRAMPAVITFSVIAIVVVRKRIYGMYGSPGPPFRHVRSSRLGKALVYIVVTTNPQNLTRNPLLKVTNIVL
jgi:hypothetical protein